MEILRTYKHLTLLSKLDDYNKIVYWVDKGDDCSEYMDWFDIEYLLNCSDSEFESKCYELF